MRLQHGDAKPFIESSAGNKICKNAALTRWRSGGWLIFALQTKKKIVELAG